MQVSPTPRDAAPRHRRLMHARSHPRGRARAAGHTPFPSAREGAQRTVVSPEVPHLAIRDFPPSQDGADIRLAVCREAACGAYPSVTPAGSLEVVRPFDARLGRPRITPNPLSARRASRSSQTAPSLSDRNAKSHHRATHLDVSRTRPPALSPMAADLPSPGHAPAHPSASTPAPLRRASSRRPRAGCEGP
ncbi:MAG: hypothetical protein BWY66_00941 [bacterium ADurb.Bin374]|nr:MAG: hypothetical protein BWY66_00941 [bacterium ADurb.Bin374]